MWRWPELRDIKADTRAALGRRLRGLDRRRRVLAGARLHLAHRRCRSGWRVCLIALVAGGSVYAALELVFRRMTQGLDVKTPAPAHRVGLLARVHVPAEQLDPRQPPLLHPHRHDVPAHQRGSDGREGHGRAAVLQGVGPAARASCCCFSWAWARCSAGRRRAPAPWAGRSALRSSLGRPAVVLHLALGRALGFPAVVFSEPIYPGALGAVLRGFNAITPVLGTSLCVFNVGDHRPGVHAAVPLARQERRRQGDAGHPLVARRPAWASPTRSCRCRRRRAAVTAGTSCTSASC